MNGEKLETGATGATGTRLADCDRLLAGAIDAPPGLREAVRAAAGRLREPMRVAVVAQIKRGKSTLVNAMLRQDVAPTAQLEATFTVSEFYAAAEPVVTVHFNDGAPPLPVAPEDFRSYTVNDPKQVALLRRIRKVEYGISNSLLERFRLLDTPGLGSIYLADSQHTLRTLGVEGFLDPEEQARLERALGRVGRTAADLHDDTVQAIDGADAILYLFDRGLNQRDASVVARFLGPLGPSLSALKVIGVLSRCDQSYWPGNEASGADLLSTDPLVEGREIAARRMAQPEMRRMFFRILPVAAIVSAGALTMDEERLSWLDELAGVEPQLLAVALSDANWFAKAPRLNGIGLPLTARAALIASLGGWGTLKAALYRRDGVPAAELRERLDSDSGVAVVRQTLVEHFGNRAAALKLDQALREISKRITVIRMAALRAKSAAAPVVNDVAAILEQIRLSDAELPEITVLENYYQDRLDLGERDGRELLRVTGEYGRSVTARLGEPDSTPLPALVKLADDRAGRWANRAEAIGLDGATATAATQISVSYGLLSRRIQTAQRLLAGDESTDDGTESWTSSAS